MLKVFLRLNIIFSVIILVSGCHFFDNFTTLFNTYYNANRLLNECEEEFQYQDEKRRITPRVFVPDQKLAVKDINPEDAPEFLQEFITDPQKIQPVKVKLDSVIEKGSKILAKHPKSDYVENTLYLMAKTFFYRSDWIPSQIKCSELIDKFPEGDLSPDAHLLVAKNYLIRKKFEAGKLMLSRCVDVAWLKGRYDILSEAFRIQAELALFEKDYEGALKPYKQAIAQSNDGLMRAKWQVDMAVLLFRMGKFRDAERYFAKVNDYSPDYMAAFEAKRYSASCFARLGEFDKAEAILDRLEKDRNNDEWRDHLFAERMNIMRLKNNDKDFLLSESYVDTAFRNSPAISAVYFEKAVEYFKKNNYTSARVYFAKCRLIRSPIYKTAARMYDLLNSWEQKHLLVNKTLEDYKNHKFSPEKKLKTLDTIIGKGFYQENVLDFILAQNLKAYYDTQTKSQANNQQDIAQNDIARKINVLQQEVDALQDLDPYSSDNINNNSQPVNQNLNPDGTPKDINQPVNQILNPDGTPKDPNQAINPNLNPDGTPKDPNQPINPNLNSDGTPKDPNQPINPNLNPDGTQNNSIPQELPHPDPTINTPSINALPTPDKPNSTMPAPVGLKRPPKPNNPNSSVPPIKQKTLPKRELSQKTPPKTIEHKNVPVSPAQSIYELGRIHDQLGNDDSAIYYYKISTEAPVFEPQEYAKYLYVYAQSIKAKDLKTSDSVYEYLIDNYPLTPYGKEAMKQQGYTNAFIIDTVKDLYTSGLRLRDARDFVFSFSQLRKVYLDYPKSPYAPKSLYALGWTYEHTLKNFDSAFYYYKILAFKYPESPYAKDVNLSVAYFQALKDGTIPDSLKPRVVEDPKSNPKINPQDINPKDNSIDNPADKTKAQNKVQPSDKSKQSSNNSLDKLLNPGSILDDAKDAVSSPEKLLDKPKEALDNPGSLLPKINFKNPLSGLDANDSTKTKNDSTKTKADTTKAK